MVCDLCGKYGCLLETVLDSYKTPEVQQVCTECAGAMNKHLRKVQSVAAKFTIDTMKRYIRQRLGLKDPK